MELLVYDGVHGWFPLGALVHDDALGGGLRPPLPTQHRWDGTRMTRLRDGAPLFVHYVDDVGRPGSVESELWQIWNGCVRDTLKLEPQDFELD